jgi:hypothetical protein
MIVYVLVVEPTRRHSFTTPTSGHDLQDHQAVQRQYAALLLR